MKAKTINEIRKDGLEILAKSLGPIGMVRFIQSFDLGRGDYTKERSQCNLKIWMIFLRILRKKEPGLSHIDLLGIIPYHMSL